MTKWSPDDFQSARNWMDGEMTELFRNWNTVKINHEKSSEKLKITFFQKKLLKCKHEIHLGATSVQIFPFRTNSKRGEESSHFFTHKQTNRGETLCLKAYFRIFGTCIQLIRPPGKL